MTLLLSALKSLASLRLTAILLALLLGVVVVLSQQRELSYLLALPLSGLALNLVAALIVTPKLRRDPWLLGFHLALLLLVLFSALNELSYKKGRVEVTEGSTFNGQLDYVEQGPLDLAPLAPLRFDLKAIEIRYTETGSRHGTFARIRVTAPAARAYDFVVADHRPFNFNGNRFYVTHNKGFAAVLAWQAKGGARPIIGSVHFPPYPAEQYSQHTTWTPPNSTKPLRLFLDMEDDPLAPGEARLFRPPAAATLVIRPDDKQRMLLKEGESVKFQSGRLTLLGWRSWMGFKVQYDGFGAHILAAALLAVLSLAIYYWRLDTTQKNAA